MPWYAAGQVHQPMVLASAVPKPTRCSRSGAARAARIASSCGTDLSGRTLYRLGRLVIRHAASPSTHDAHAGCTHVATAGSRARSGARGLTGAAISLLRTRAGDSIGSTRGFRLDRSAEG